VITSRPEGSTWVSTVEGKKKRSPESFARSYVEGRLAMTSDAVTFFEEVDDIVLVVVFADLSREREDVV
jgi:hypothetical protein